MLLDQVADTQIPAWKQVILKMPVYETAQRNIPEEYLRTPQLPPRKLFTRIITMFNTVTFP
jgi:hypothetical protein